MGSSFFAFLCAITVLVVKHPLVIIDNLNVFCFAVVPREADSPLIVDANTVLPQPVSLESLKPIPARCAQILKSSRRIQPPQPRPRRSLERLKLPYAETLVQRLCVCAAKRLYQGATIPGIVRPTYYVKQYSAIDFDHREGARWS